MKQHIPHFPHRWRYKLSWKCLRLGQNYATDMDKPMQYNGVTTTDLVRMYASNKQDVTHISHVSVIHDAWKTFLLALDLLRLPLLEPALHLGTTAVSVPVQSLLRTAYLFSLPTFTVAIILRSGPGMDNAKQVNSKKLECSEYGTPACSAPVLKCLRDNTHRTS